MDANDYTRIHHLIDTIAMHTSQNCAPSTSSTSLPSLRVALTQSSMSGWRCFLTPGPATWLGGLPGPRKP